MMKTNFETAYSNDGSMIIMLVNFLNALDRMDVYVAATIEEAAIIFQDMGFVCSQTQLVIHPRREVYKHRKGNAVLLPRRFTLSSSATDQEDARKVHNCRNLIDEYIYILYLNGIYL